MKILMLSQNDLSKFGMEGVSRMEKTAYEIVPVDDGIKNELSNSKTGNNYKENRKSKCATSIHQHFLWYLLLRNATDTF